jgi:hypothetical protein
MRPTSEALQVFYGTVPLILVAAGAMLQMHREAKTAHLLLRDILERLRNIETRLAALESPAGIVYHP